MSDIPPHDQCDAPLFRAFSWHRPDVKPSYHKTLCEYSHDVGNGMAVLLALIEFHESQERDGVPLLAAVDKGALLRLAITSSKLLAHFAYTHISRANRAQRASLTNAAEGNKT